MSVLEENKMESGANGGIASSSPMSSQFPLGSLPGPIRQLVEEGAAAFPVPYELIAIPAFVSLGAAIGNSRVIQLKEGWVERGALYAAVVSESGTMKSPAMDLATRFLKDLQSTMDRTWTSNATVESLARVLQDTPRGLLMYQDELTAWVRGMNQYRQGKGTDKEFFSPRGEGNHTWSIEWA